MLEADKMFYQAEKALQQVFKDTESIASRSLSKIVEGCLEHGKICCGDMNVTADIVHQNPQQKVLHITQTGSGHQWLVWALSASKYVEEGEDLVEKKYTRYEVNYLWDDQDNGEGTTDYGIEMDFPVRPNMAYWETRSFRPQYIPNLYSICKIDTTDKYNSSMSSGMYGKYKYFCNAIEWLGIDLCAFY